MSVQIDPPSEIVQWLREGAPGVSLPNHVLQRLGDGLAAEGCPIDRGAVFVRTPHPNMFGRRFLWEPDKDVDVNEAPYEVLDSDMFKLSPIVWVMDNNAAMRKRLQTDDIDQYEVLVGLREEGFTDYVAHPLAFMNGEVNGVSWATRREGGFSPRDLALLESVRAPLARVAEIYALRRTATVVLETYVGGRTGARILAGQIKRGDRQTIEAVILLSDMVGFSTLTDRESEDRVLDLLNRYYDCLVPAVDAHDGEILKFIGDAMLAIWPVEGGNRAAACEKALAAANDVLSRIEAANDAEQGADGLAIGCGIGLNLGPVTYGNIGSGNRLDFTVIGSAVNQVARIEALCRRTGLPLLAGAPFAEAAPMEMRPVGEFVLKGIPGMHPVFAPAA